MLTAVPVILYHISFIRFRYPGLVVNPLCFESHQKLQDSQIVVRSFKTGKFLKAFRSCVKEISPSNIPAKIDPVWRSMPLFIATISELDR